MVRYVAPYLAVILPSGYFVQPLRGCKFFVDFTPRVPVAMLPTPAAIIVMTPTGSGKEKLRERLQRFQSQAGSLCYIYR
jgi:hypothetical protein